MAKVPEADNSHAHHPAMIGIVASRFNGSVVDRLLTGCIQTLEGKGAGYTVVRVPGAFEIPVAVKALIKNTECDAVVALGAIIRGETPHFEYIANECSRGLASIALEMETPVIFGVLTVNTTAQALDRAGSEESNKGVEAALAAIDMVTAMKVLRG